MPFVPFKQLLEYAVNADIGILLYPNDRIGNFYQCPERLTEYAACRLPLVTSNFPVLENLVLKFGIGKTCNPCDASEIAQAVQSPRNVFCSKAERRSPWFREVCKLHLAYEHGVAPLVRPIREMMGRK